MDARTQKRISRCRDLLKEGARKSAEGLRELGALLDADIPAIAFGMRPGPWARKYLFPQLSLRVVQHKMAAAQVVHASSSWMKALVADEITETHCRIAFRLIRHRLLDDVVLDAAKRLPSAVAFETWVREYESRPDGEFEGEVLEIAGKRILADLTGDEVLAVEKARAAIEASAGRSVTNRELLVTVFHHFLEGLAREDEVQTKKRKGLRLA